MKNTSTICFYLGDDSDTTVEMGNQGIYRLSADSSPVVSRAYSIPRRISTGEKLYFTFLTITYWLNKSQTLLLPAIT